MNLHRYLWRKRMTIVIFALIYAIYQVWRRKPSQPIVKPLDFIIATGADATYFQGLKNLIGSIHFHCPTCLVWIYDLGLQNVHHEEIKSWCNTELKWAPDFNITKLNPVPSHLLYLDVYAWKPVAIKQALDEANQVLWLDAGSSVVSSLSPILDILEKEQVFLIQGQDNDVTRWTHPDVWQRFNVDSSRFSQKPSFSGNTLGFTRHSNIYETIVQPWYQCALEFECIMPPGSNFSNHRFDQSVLSVLLYGSGLSLKPRTGMIASEQGQLNGCKGETKKVIWTARRADTCYLDDAVC